MGIRKGVIRGFSGSESSYLAFLFIEDDELGLVPVPCNSGPTLRLLSKCFENVVGSNQEVDDKNGGHVGQVIYWSYDVEGLSLQGFTPVALAPQSMMEEYLNGLDSEV